MRSKTQCGFISRATCKALASAFVLLLVVVASQSAQTQTFKTRYSFCSQNNCTDGAQPYARLVQAINGTFYGTTSGGGSGSNAAGTVFKITPSGTLTTLYSFSYSQSQNDWPDGDDPAAGLVQATDGNLYGTAYEGGANSVGGTVFKITPSGTLTTLYSFCSQSNCTDGGVPTRGWSRPPMGTSTGQRTSAEPATLHRWLWHGLQNHPTRHADDAAQLRRHGRLCSPTPGWFKPPMGTSTGQRTMAGPSTMARSSKSPQAAR